MQNCIQVWAWIAPENCAIIKAISFCCLLKYSGATPSTAHGTRTRFNAKLILPCRAQTVAIFSSQDIHTHTPYMEKLVQLRSKYEVQPFPVYMCWLYCVRACAQHQVASWAEAAIHILPRIICTCSCTQALKGWVRGLATYHSPHFDIIPPWYCA